MELVTTRIPDPGFWGVTYIQSLDVPIILGYVPVFTQFNFSEIGQRLLRLSDYPSNTIDVNSTTNNPTTNSTDTIIEIHVTNPNHQYYSIIYYYLHFRFFFSYQDSELAHHRPPSARRGSSPTAIKFAGARLNSGFQREFYPLKYLNNHKTYSNSS